MNYVSTALMVLSPSESLYHRVERHFGSKRDRMSNDEALYEDPPEREGQLPNYDGDIVNIEFGCNGSVLVLPKAYATLSPEYKKDEQDGLSV